MVAADHSQSLLAVIPARGGSKRIPGKNIIKFGGAPMIVHTIRAAIESGLFGRVVVSTDDRRIADTSIEAGAEVPFLRDSTLADDHTPVSAATVNAIERLDPGGQEHRAVAQLMANCPLRTADDIVDSFRQFEESGSESQLSVVRFNWLNPWWAMRREASMRLNPLFEREATERSQDLPELFCPTGAIWWARTDVLRLERTFHIPGRTGWEISWDHGIDIDTADDLEMAEAILRIKHRH